MWKRTSEWLGRIAGVMLAPITGFVSAIRRSRMFHPRGSVFQADVKACATSGPWSSLAARLEGPAVVRLSSAWWKARERRDVLGCAIRFTRYPETAPASHGDDQDLLLATIRRPWLTPFAPITTRYHDFFANDYWGVSPFRTREAGLIEWRLCPDGPVPGGNSRGERLRLAVSRRDAGFTLEARPYRRFFDFRRREGFHPVARIELRAPMDVDQEALRFDPWLSGRGIEPVGFVQSLRIATYRASQWARPSSRRKRGGNAKARDLTRSETRWPQRSRRARPPD